MPRQVHPTPAQAAAACASLIEEGLLAAANAGRKYTLCLGGGATPKAVFFLLAKRRGLPWEAAELYWGDERYVPEDHKDSNYRSARDILLPAAKAAAVHPMPTAAKDPAADARRYETLLRARWPKEAAPAFDLQLLGLGADGHTASLFPGTPALEESQRWVAVVRPDGDRAPGAALHEGPRVRLTLTPPALSGARLTVFLVVGEPKAEAVRRTLVDGDTPAALVKPSGAAPLWVLDAEAAGRL
ncbi:MAG: 6-phosphogluconolactonase [Elusimicrobia bacterium]|nr:6-phosphogluconolactonase [Elusimicrobiota bacterium]